MTDIRNLVSIRTVDAIEPIDGADRIEVAVVGGWRVVVAKEAFKEGESIVYFEIDSALPVGNPAFNFLIPRGIRPIEGKSYHVLKTIRLRGEYSQGLVLPLSDFDSQALSSDDLAEALGVVKYEKPAPAEMGKAAGAFPLDIVAKTDAERVQNLTKNWDKIVNHEAGWYATEKIDGTSTTYIVDFDGSLRICTRNWEVKSEPGDMRTEVAESFGLPGSVEPGTVIQGELYGEGVQNNPLQIKGRRFAAFNVFKMHEDGPSTQLPPTEWPEAIAAIRVPVLDWELPSTIAEVVEQVDGMKSQIAPQRRAEGVVWHSKDAHKFMFLGNRACFKAISNTYLAKQKD